MNPKSKNMKLFKNFIIVIFCFLIVNPSFSRSWYVSASGNSANNGLDAAHPISEVMVKQINFLPGDVLLFKAGETFTGPFVFDANDGNNPTNVLTIGSYGMTSAIPRAYIYSSTGDGIQLNNTQGIYIKDLDIIGSKFGVDITFDNGNGVYILTNETSTTPLSNITLDNLNITGFGNNGVFVYSVDKINPNGTKTNAKGFFNIILNKLTIQDIKENGILTYSENWQLKAGQNAALEASYNKITQKNINDIKITYCTIFDINGWADPTKHKGSGIILGSANIGLISNCKAYNCGKNNIASGGPVGIWTFESDRVVIQFCEAYNNSNGTGADGGGFDLDGGVTNSIMQYNYSHNNAGAGFFAGTYVGASPWNNNIIRFNISENDGRHGVEGGISLFIYDPNPTASLRTTLSNLDIYNNTVFISPTSNGTKIDAFNVLDYPADGLHTDRYSNIRVLNNVFITTGNSRLIQLGASYPAGFGVFDGNLFCTGNGNGTVNGSFRVKDKGVTYTSQNAWKIANPTVAKGVVPFVNNTNKVKLSSVGVGGTLAVSNYDTRLLKAYKPLATSPIINAGIDLKVKYNITNGYVDYYGSSVSLSSKDIGAGKYIVASIRQSSEEFSWEDGEKLEENILIYPNPNQGSFKVDLSSFADEVLSGSVEVFRTDGRMVNQIAIKGKKILDVSVKESGIYLIKVIHNEKVYTQKVVSN